MVVRCQTGSLADSLEDGTSEGRKACIDTLHAAESKACNHISIELLMTLVGL